MDQPPISTSSPAPGVQAFFAPAQRAAYDDTEKEALPSTSAALNPRFRLPPAIKKEAGQLSEADDRIEEEENKCDSEVNQKVDDDVEDMDDDHDDVPLMPPPPIPTLIVPSEQPTTAPIRTPTGMLPPPLPPNIRSAPSTAPATPSSAQIAGGQFFAGPPLRPDGTLPPPPPPPAHAVLARMSMSQSQSGTQNPSLSATSSSSGNSTPSQPRISVDTTINRPPSSSVTSPAATSVQSSPTPAATPAVVPGLQVRGNSVRGRIRGGNNQTSGHNILTMGQHDRRSPSPRRHGTAPSTDRDDIEDKELVEFEREMAAVFISDSSAHDTPVTPITVPRVATAAFSIPREAPALAPHTVVQPEDMNLPLTSVEQARQDSDRIFRMLRAQVNSARTAIERQQKDGTSLEASTSMGPASEEPYVPAYQIPTFFSKSPAKSIPEPLVRTCNQVFCIGPVSYASERKKQWKPRFAILFRDRLELFTKFSDPTPRMVIALEGMTVSLSSDSSSPGGYSVSLAKSKAERIFLRGDVPPFYLSCSIPMGQNPSAVSIPDVITLHRAWSVAIRMRVESIEYMKKSKLQSALPDERVMNQFDLQVRSPCVRHVLEYYNPAVMNINGTLTPITLANYRADSLMSAPSHWSLPASGLTVEVTTLDLCGGSMSIDSASSLAKLFIDPDCVPIVGLRFGGIHMETMLLDIFLTACSRHPVSPLVELDFIYVDTAASDRLDFFIRLFTEMNLPQLRHVAVRDSNLNDEFMSAWSKGVKARCEKHTPNLGATIRLQTIDLSTNDISDTGATCFIEMLTESATLTSDLTAISFAMNPVSDASAVKLAKWIATPRPAPGQKSALFTHKMGRSIALQHISLAHSNVSSKGARAFADAACWSLTLRSLDLSGCSAVNEEGIAALSHLGQINESLDDLHFAQYKLGIQGLTAMRLFYRYAIADTTLFEDASKKHFSQAALACEYTPLQNLNSSNGSSH